MAQANLPLSLTQPFRRGQIIVGGGWRLFFAPFNQSGAQNGSVQGNSPIDFQVQGPFLQGTPPPGFWDMGQIKNFKRTPGSKIGMIRSGYRGAVREQFRGEVGETFEFSFMEMSRLAFKIATGTEVFNVIQPAVGSLASQTGPLNSSGMQAVPMGASGYIQAGVNVQTPGFTQYANKPALFVPAGSGAVFPVGTLIVCDNDYDNAYGLTGSGGTNVFQGAVQDIDFYRKVSDFVARVVAVLPNYGGSGQDLLLLNKPFIGGGNNPTGVALIGPAPTSKIQIIKGYVAREGGSYIADWTCLALMNTTDGSQIATYYPHASPNQFKDLASSAIENAGTTDLAQYSLDCVMTALAFDDPYDGETIVSYTAYFPAPTAYVDPQI